MSHTQENKVAKDFYDNIDRENVYTSIQKDNEHSAHKYIVSFIEKYNLKDKKCLEIGSSKGIFQDLVEDYTGLDIAASLTKYYRKRYVTPNEDGTYPFSDSSFDAIWSYAVHEHIPNLDQALMEFKRVLKPGGVVFFAPAWQCRSWFADGYPVRPYSDFDIKGKIVKASIPIRNNMLFRSIFIFPKRCFRHLQYLFGKKYMKINYKRLTPNYEKFWLSDSDAVNSIDPHDAILWFISNGFKCLSHPSHFKFFVVKTGALIFEKL